MFCCVWELNNTTKSRLLLPYFFGNENKDSKWGGYRVSGLVQYPEICDMERVKNAGKTRGFEDSQSTVRMPRQHLPQVRGPA